MQQKPVNFNIFRLALSMSITAKVSILHRVAGVVLFLATPWLLWLLHYLLTAKIFCISTIVDVSTIKFIVFVILLWAFWHHLFAEIRLLMLDLRIGIKQRQAVNTAYFALIAGIVMTIASVLYLC